MLMTRNLDLKSKPRVSLSRIHFVHLLPHPEPDLQRQTQQEHRGNTVSLLTMRTMLLRSSTGGFTRSLNSTVSLVPPIVVSVPDSTHIWRVGAIPGDFRALLSSLKRHHDLVSSVLLPLAPHEPQDHLRQSKHCRLENLAPQTAADISAGHGELCAKSRAAPFRV